MSGALCGYENTSSGSPCKWNENERGPCPWHDEDTDTPNSGRPTKLNKEVVDQITTHIAEGKSDNAAFRLADLHPSTKANWLGKVDPEDVDKEPEFEDDPYGYFFRRYTHARGLGEDFYFENMMRLALENEDHRFVATLLKQRYPDSWGETETGVDAPTIEVASDVVTIKDGSEFKH